MAKKAAATAKPSGRNQAVIEPPSKIDRATTRTGGIKVMATALGYYDDKRRRDGDVFTIENMKQFSERWMELVDPETPERITTGNEAIRQHHDQVNRAKHGLGEPTAPTGQADVLRHDDDDD